MRRLPAVPFFYTLEFVLSMPAFVVIAVYLVRDVGLSPLQLVLVGTVMEAAVFVSEVPTGVFADTYSRRASLVVSFVVQGIGWMIVGSFADFAAVLIGWAVWGFGYTFMSGAYEAWITDEVGPDNVGRVFARGFQLSYAGALVGLGLSIALAAVSLRLAIISGGALLIAAGVATALLMPETGFTRASDRERRGSWTELRATASRGARYVRVQPLLLVIMVITFFTGMSSEAVDRLTEAHFIRDIGLPRLGSLDPVVWFGIFGAGSLVIGLVASQFLVRRFERGEELSLARLLLALTAVQAIAMAAFGLAGSIVVALGALWLYRLMRALVAPVYLTWLNQNITDSSVRATVISIAGQSDAIGQAGGGPLLGGVGNLFGIRAALLAGAAVLMPALGLYARALRHGGREPELEALPEAAP